MKKVCLLISLCLFMGISCASTGEGDGGAAFFSFLSSAVEVGSEVAKVGAEAYQAADAAGLLEEETTTYSSGGSSSSSSSSVSRSSSSSSRGGGNLDNNTRLVFANVHGNQPRPLDYGDIKIMVRGSASGKTIKFTGKSSEDTDEYIFYVIKGKISGGSGFETLVNRFVGMSVGDASGKISKVEVGNSSSSSMIFYVTVTAENGSDSEQHIVTFLFSSGSGY